MPDLRARGREFWKRALAATEACLTVEELGRLSNGSLPEQAVARAHIAGCLRCQTELAMLKEFQSVATRPGEAAQVSWITAELERRFDQISGAAPLPASRPTPDSERPGWWHRLFDPRPLRMAALGLAALLVVVAVGLHLRGGEEPELASNAVRGRVVLRSEELAVLGPTGDLKQAPTELRWQVTPGAARYLVKVMEVDRTELWQTESSQTSVSLPSAVRATIVPGKTLLWQVTAVDSARKTVAGSQILRFRLAIGPSSSKD